MQWAAVAVALVAMLMLVLAPQGAVSSVAGADAQERSAAPAPERYRVAYSRWRRRLQRHGLFVGRNLLLSVRAADGPSRPPSAAELRRSIHRMRVRWVMWLRTTSEGRAVLFEGKVRREVPAWGRAQLRAIAHCESRNNPRAVGGGGTYRGLYQFSFSTWGAVGGSGDPAAASRSEQTWRAWLLLSRHGSGHWPMCG